MQKVDIKKLADNQSSKTSDTTKTEASKIKRLGVIGGGQLAKMMADAAKVLGIELIVQTPQATDPAVAIASETIFAPIDDANATVQLSQRCDVITFENEFVNKDALSLLEKQGVCFRPSLQVLSHLLDKYEQRCYLQQLGLPQPNFIALDKQWQESNFSPMLSQFNFPVVLKARRHGYDGQGTFICKNLDALQNILENCPTKQQREEIDFLLEEFVPFERELAVIAARSVDGKIVVYPIVETQQEEQVCRRVFVPADINSTTEAEIQAIAHTLLDKLQAIGVFGIELFLTTQGKVLVNEIAPRTHNSGHFSLDACETSQFEQHLRAVCDLCLGDSSLRSHAAVMVNLLGYEYSHDEYIAKRQQLAKIPQAYLYWYGKTESRPGRKLGHITVLLDQQNQDQAKAIAQTIESIWYTS